MAMRRCAAGGLSAMTVTSLLNPADLLKTRLQTMSPAEYKQRGIVNCARDIVQKEGGLVALWKVGLGVSAARSLMYSGLRMGLYDPVRDFMSTVFHSDQKSNNNYDAGVMIKMWSGLCTGMLGSAIVNPLDVIKIRAQSVQDASTTVNNNKLSSLPKTQQVDGMMKTFVHIMRNEGVINGLYKGTMLTMVRAGALTAAQLSSYDHSKYLLTTHFPDTFSRDKTSTHIFCAFIAGIVATYSCAPFDVVKTRYMNDRGKTEFTGILDCVAKIAKNEGFRGFYRASFACWLRLGPFFLISLPLYESFRKMFGVGAM